MCTGEVMVTEVGPRTRSVLLIDDDASIRRMLRFALQSAGFDVTMAATGGEALQLLEHYPMDAVILDLGLPDALGGAVLEHLWDRHKRIEGGRPPVWVVISAQDRVEAMKRYGPLGEHFLPKPFDPWALVDLLERMVAPGST